MEIVEMKIHFRTGMSKNVVPIASERIIRFPDQHGELHKLAAAIKACEKAELERIKAPSRGFWYTVRERLANARIRRLKASLERKTETGLRNALKNLPEVEIFDRNKGVYGAFRPIKDLERHDVVSILESDMRFFDSEYLSLFPLYMSGGTAIAVA
jgi:hypothetical protein